MGFKLHPERPPAEEIERVLHEQIARAVKSASDQTQSAAERARQARVACKKLRAILQFVRCHAPKRIEREDRLIRDAARSLADLRDQGAASSSLERLRKQLKARLEPRVFVGARIALERSSPQRNLSARDADATLQNFVRKMCKAGKRVKRSTSAGHSSDTPFAYFAPGFHRSYAQAKRAFQNAGENAKSDVLHTWRKRTKTHLYHYRLLGRAWPAMMVPWHCALKQVASLLGEEHDLAFLRERILGAFPAGKSERDVTNLLKQIAERRAELRRDALVLGERLFAEKPDVVVHRVQAWWTAKPVSEMSD